MKKKFIDSSIIIASLTRKLSLSMLILAALISPSWGQVKEAEIVDNPTVKNDRVTVRIQVKGNQKRPIMGLQDTNFQLKVDGQEVDFDSDDWKSPQESEPPPAWIIVMLDLSGSMDKRDSSNIRKIDGAINAIRQLIKASSERGDKTQIAIVPFGEPSPPESEYSCEGYVVNQASLDRFFVAGDAKLENNLEYLEGLKPCASTNLYEPLKKAIKFLGNTSDTRFYPPENSSQPQPRLSIILLSDGYHTAGNEERDFQSLTTLLRRNKNIIVHTLGYGLTPEELGKKYKLGKPATRKDVGTGSGKVPESEFVDQQRLAEIAELTGGISEFSGDAEAIAENLQLFLNSLLGEYEITYTHPNAERASKHNVQVVVNSQGDKPVESSPKGYIITVFGRSLPLQVRLGMFICILFMLVLAGMLPFYLWGKGLKQEAQGD
ncbi:MAG: vWA domain-containing protein [Calothrix sp. MO_167.B42]|nr:vWA domain-containing protein [Calothrix sp. MO_167.B42]